MSTPFHHAWLKDMPIVGILRGYTLREVEALVPTVHRAGLRQVEITMNTEDAPKLIACAADQGAGLMNIGAGTVTDEETLDTALEAGAGFIVTPILAETVIKRCVDESIPVFPGAFTPTEIHKAWDLGATMVKVFPANDLGPAYLHNIKGPLPHIKLMPTGGVTLDSIPSYRGLADAFGIGNSLFGREAVRNDDWGVVEKRCRAFCDAVRDSLVA